MQYGYQTFWYMRLGIWLKCMLMCLAIFIIASLASAVYAQSVVDEKPSETSTSAPSEQSQKNDALDTQSETSESSEEISEPSQFERYVDNEELILSLRVDKWQLAELFVIKYQQGVFIPFDQFVLAMDFAINQSPTGFDGWYIKETNTFSMNTESTTMTLVNMGQSLIVPPELLREEIDGLYVHSSLLAQWFAIEFAFDLQDQYMEVTSSETLPILAKYQRRSRSVSSRDRNISVFPSLSSDYVAASPQTLDVSLNYFQNPVSDTTSYSLVGTRDFAFIKNNISLSGNSNDWLQSSYISFESVDVQNDLLGLGISQVEFGDVRPVRVSGGASGDLSTGIRFTNSPLRADFNKEVTTITGMVQEGWDAELYRNGILIGSQTDIQSGLYEFTDIELFVGKNTLEVVLYGPQGQKQTEIIEKNLENFLDVGQIHYQASLNKLGSSFLSSNRTDDQDGFAFSAEMKMGVHDNTELNAAVSSLFDAGEEDINSAQIGISSVLADEWLLSAVTNIDDQDNVSVSVNNRFNLLTQTFSTGFSHSENAEGQASQSLSILHGTSIPIGDNAVSVQNSYRHSKLDEISDATAISTSLGYRVGQYSFNLDYQHQSSQIERVKEVQNTLNLNSQISFDNFDLRLLGQWDLDSNELNVFNSQVSIPISNDFKTRLTYQYIPEQDSHTGTVNLSWRNEAMLLSLNASDSNQSGLNMGLSVRTGLAFLPNNPLPVMQRSGITSQGTVVIQFYLDNNYNGIFDLDETPIEGVKIRAKQSGRTAISDRQGRAVLSRLSNYVQTDIVIDEESLPDIFIYQGVEDFAVTPRAGYVEHLYYPLVYTNELEGIAYVQTDGERLSPLGNVPIELVDKNGRVVQATTTEFDGFYLFTKTMPGHYEVRIEPDFAQRRLLANGDMPIVMQTGNDIVRADDLVALQQQRFTGYAASIGRFADPDFQQAFVNHVHQHVVRLHNASIVSIPDSALATSDNDEGESTYLTIVQSQDKSAVESYCDQITAMLPCEVITYEWIR